MTRRRNITPGNAIPAAPDDRTCVLHWVPPYVTGRACGWWELQPEADYTSGRPLGRDDAILNAPRDVPAEALAWWAAAKLGYPVMLVESGADIRGLWPPRLWRCRREPVYFIDPAVAP